MQALERQLIENFQRDLPLVKKPYAAMAEKLGVSEEEVIDTLKALRESGIITRVGPVFNHKRAGASTLAAMAIPEEQLESIADIVSAYDEVNHNYAREHHYNLWFVVTTPNQQHLDDVLADMETRTGFAILNLPMEMSYHIDLGFKPQWA